MTKKKIPNIIKLYIMLHEDRARRLCLSSKKPEKSCHLGCPFMKLKPFHIEKSCFDILGIKFGDCGVLK